MDDAQYGHVGLISQFSTPCSYCLSRALPACWLAPFWQARLFRLTPYTSTLSTSMARETL